VNWIQTAIEGRRGIMTGISNAVNSSGFGKMICKHWPKAVVAAPLLGYNPLRLKNAVRSVG
jgi:hypothetical protein